MILYESASLNSGLLPFADVAAQPDAFTFDAIDANCRLLFHRLCFGSLSISLVTSRCCSLAETSSPLSKWTIAFSATYNLAFL